MELLYSETSGVSTDVLYYDPDKDSFYIKMYHCGVIDPGEDFFDGAYYISRSDGFEYMIRHSRLDKAAEFYDPQRDGEMIADLLEKQESHFFGYVHPKLHGEKNATYYVFPNRKYVIYYNETYFTPQPIPTCNFAAVKTILDNASKIRVHRYNYNKGKWTSEPLIQKEAAKEQDNGVIAATVSYHKKEEGLKDLVSSITKRGEDICLLKETRIGNSHDENWGNVLYVIHEGPWKDSIESIASEHDISGWQWDEPIIKHTPDLEACLKASFEDDCAKARWIYTCDESGRKKYAVTSRFAGERKITWKISACDYPQAPQKSESEIREELMNELREDIITYLERYSGEFHPYKLASIGPSDEGFEELFNRFAKDSWMNDIWVWLNLESREISAEVSTYPNAFGACRQDFICITPSQFSVIVQKNNLKKSLQVLKAQEDWDELFDDTLTTAIAEAKAKKLEKEHRLYAVAIPEQLSSRTPKMNIVFIDLELKQTYNRRHFRLTKQDGSYHIEYRNWSPINQTSSKERELTPIESVWVEDLVERTLSSTDESEWQSMPGGDLMNVTIQIADTEVFVRNEEVPLKKFVDLHSKLWTLLAYGSKIVSEEIKPDEDTEKPTPPVTEKQANNKRGKPQYRYIPDQLSVVEIASIIAFPIIFGLLTFFTNRKKRPNSAKSALLAMLAGFVGRVLFFVFLLFAVTRITGYW